MQGRLFGCDSFDSGSRQVNPVAASSPSGSIWDPSVEVEESPYRHRGEPLVLRHARRNGSRQPVVVDLFCGAGGGSVGFAAAGFDVLGGVDIHRPSMETFSANHPESGAILGDIRGLSPELLREVAGGAAPDVLVAGVPCQGFSRSNRKRHDDDPRNYLFREFLRFVEALRPPALLLENVSGIRSAAKGAFVEEIASAIRRLGYCVDFAILNAADYGVPQLRQRVFFVGVAGGRKAFRWPLPSHGFEAGRPGRVVRDAIGDLPPLEVGERVSNYTEPAQCEYQARLRGSEEVLHNHQAPSHPPEVQRKIAATPPGEPIYPRFKQRIRLAWDRPSPTQVAGGIRSQYQFGHPSQARGLTIRERCRIQSFPDSYVIHGGLVQGRVQTGNAIPPLLAEALASAMLEGVPALTA